MGRSSTEKIGRAITSGVVGFFSFLGRAGTIGLICSAFTAAVVYFTYFLPLKAIWLTDLWMQDRVMQMGRHTPVNEDMVLLGIDSATLALQQDLTSADEHGAITLMRSPYPYSREVWAMAIERVLEAGAKLVVVDILFYAATPADNELRRVLDKYADRVVIAYEFSQVQAEGRADTLVSTANFPSSTLLPPTPHPDKRIGFVSLWPHSDGKTRSAYLATTVGELEGRPASVWEPRHHSLAGSAVRALGRGDLIGDTGDPKNFRLTDMTDESSGRLPYAPRSIYGIFDDKIWAANYDSGKGLEGKIVFLAPAAPSFQDNHPTAEGEFLGVHLHMNILAATLADEFYERAHWVVGLWVTVLMGLAAFLVIAFVKRPVLKLSLLFVVSLGYLALVLFVYDGMDLLLPAAPPVLAALSGGIFAFGFDFAIERRRELRLRRTLERYTSRELVSEILSNRTDYMASLGGAQREVTVLFSDIRGFTSLTEELEAQALVAQLNEYLGEMVQSIFAERGTVDKFIGDAIMAVWGSVSTGGAHVDATHAVAAALDMCHRLRGLNQMWIGEGRPEFANGIGIHMGEAIFGNIGSAERSDPTVIGDAVNLASRLEGLTKKYGCEIIVSDSVAEQVRGEFELRDVDFVRVLGKQEPIAIYSVLGRAGEVPWDAGVPAGWDDGLAAYRAQKFAEAENIFAQCQGDRPGDFLSGVFLERAQKMKENPPGEGWDGVEVMGSK